MQFAERKSQGEQFELAVEDYLHRFAKLVAKNGTEHTHPEFSKAIICLEDRAAKAVRFAPDGVALLNDERLIHWEAKIGENLERSAYEAYLGYAQMGCRVVLFVQRSVSQVYWQDVRRIEFVPSEDVVGKFPESLRHPVIDGWISPRLGHGNAGRGSGTAYKQIDFDSMNRIGDWG